MMNLEPRVLQNIIELITLLFALVGLINFIIWLAKRDLSIPALLFITFFAAISSIAATPIPLALAGIYSLFKAVFKLFKKKQKKTERDKKDKLDLNDSESIYLDSELGIIHLANIYRGIYISGSAGSGKSKSLFYPIIKQLITNNFSGILYDFKSPELSEFAHYVSKNNSNINFAFLNFKNYKISDRINPLHPNYVTSQAVAFELSSTLINNLLPESIKKKDFWTRSSISVVAGAIWYLRNNHPEKSTLPHLVAMILSFPSVSLVDVISKDLECIGMISSIKEALDQNAEKMLAGVVGTIKTAFGQLNIPEVFYLLSSNDVDLDLNNPNNPTFLCLGNNSSLSNTYAPVLSLVISVCLRKLNEPNKAKSCVIIDESPTLYVPGLEQLPATARSNKVATIIGVQDYSQMIDKYGDDKAQVLVSNLGNQFYGRTILERSAKQICALFGKEDRTYVSNSTSKGRSSGGMFSGTGSNSNNHSVSQSIQQRERVTIKDVTNLPAGKFYGVIAEGNHKELLGSQLGQVDSQYLSFDEKPNTDIKKLFKTIYDDVNDILNSSSKQINEKLENDFKIELS